MTQISARHPWRSMLLLLAALLMRAIVPQGYMPSTGGAGELTARICGQPGTIAIALGGHGQDLPDKHTAVDHPCAFASLSAPGAPPPDTTQVVPAAATVAPEPRPLTPAALLASPRDFRPSSRAPPVV